MKRMVRQLNLELLYAVAVTLMKFRGVIIWCRSSDIDRTASLSLSEWKWLFIYSLNLGDMFWPSIPRAECSDFNWMFTRIKILELTSSFCLFEEAVLRCYVVHHVFYYMTQCKACLRFWLKLHVLFQTFICMISAMPFICHVKWNFLCKKLLVNKESGERGRLTNTYLIIRNLKLLLYVNRTNHIST
jgi:hypothetical protein